MPSVDLTIRFHEAAQRQPTAWFVPGTTAQWLDEILVWEVPHADVQIYLVPDLQRRSEPAGALIVPPAGAVVQPSQRALPYGRLAGRVYLPVEARLQPEVTDTELAALLSEEISVYVFHPYAGLIGYSAVDAHRVSDLLTAPPLRESEWQRADAGLAVNTRLLSIRPDDPPSADRILRQSQDDISSRPSQLDQLPASPQEPSAGPLSKLGRTARSGLARAALWLTSKMPGGASQRTWVNSVETWAQSMLHEVNSALSAMRNKELLRLLNLLDNDPDEGLRYAVPLSGDAHRGLAPPTGRLGPRDVDFNLGRLGGGSAAEIWELSWEHHQRLVARYRELADREIRLGRHRRAAYIFAELLDDLPAAAACLMDGGHYREAAVLYRDRLRRPREAARCLGQGGLLFEAIEIYEQLEEFEQAAELYERLDRADEAQAAYRKAADARAAAGDFLKAAELTEEKLGSPQDALQMLDAAWPSAGQAGRCLEASFDMRGRHGMHAASRRRVAELREEVVPRSQVVTLADTLSGVSRSYPDERVRGAVADACRVVVSRRLPDAAAEERQRLVHAVLRLVPQDRLLERDCMRFLRGPAPRPAPRPCPVLPDRPTPICQFSLPPRVRWTKVIAAGETIFAAGKRGREVVVVRANWQGQVQQPTRKPWRLATRPYSLLLACNSRSGWLYTHPVFHEPVTYHRVFPLADGFSRQIPAGPPPGCDAQTFGMTQTAGILWLAKVSRPEQLELHGFAENGQLLTTRALTLEHHVDFESLLSMWLMAHHDRLQLAVANQLITLGPGDQIEREEFPSKIHCLTVSALHLRPRSVVTFERGGVVMWGGFDLGHREPFGTDLACPRVALTRSGVLVAADDSACEFYDTKNRRLRPLGSLDLAEESLLDVLPAPRGRQFALCTKSGRVLVYELPALGSDDSH